MSDANAFSEEVLAAAAEVVRTSVKPAGQFSPFTRSGQPRSVWPKRWAGGRGVLLAVGGGRLRFPRQGRR